MKSIHDPAFILPYYPTPCSWYYEKSRFYLYGYPGYSVKKERKEGVALRAVALLRRGWMKMCECWQKVILNSSALRYNTFIMQKKQAPGQPPFNPFMFPFPFPFPPPPFMNPMMNMPPKGATGQEAEHLYPPPSMPMPPYPYPPFPMMYPPPPEAFFRFHQSKNAKDAQEVGFELNTKEKGESALQRKRMAMALGKQLQKKPSQIIILSDDQENKGPSKPTPYHKPDADNKINMANSLNYELKPRRTERKIVPAAKPEPIIKKTRQIEKKAHSKLYREKQQLKNLDLKEAKYAPPTSTETAHEHFNRSTRIKYLTIKDGKGKIMIGEEFQASITPFLPKDEYFTIWVADRKNQLLSRFHKDGL